MSQIQAKVLYVSAPVENASSAGTFYNQDILVSSLTSNDTLVMRVTSGPQRKDISAFALKEGEEIELTYYARAQMSKDNRLFNQLNVTAVERDRAKWGQAHATNDASDIVARLKALGGPAPAAPARTAIPTPPPAQAAQASAPANPWGVNPSAAPF